MSLPTITLRTGSSTSSIASKKRRKKAKVKKHVSSSESEAKSDEESVEESAEASEDAANDAASEVASNESSSSEDDAEIMKRFMARKREMMARRSKVSPKRIARKNAGPKAPAKSKPKAKTRAVARTASRTTTKPKSRIVRRKLAKGHDTDDTNDSLDDSVDTVDTRHKIMRQRIIDVKGESIDWNDSDDDSMSGSADNPYDTDDDSEWNPSGSMISEDVLDIPTLDSYSTDDGDDGDDGDYDEGTDISSDMWDRRTKADIRECQRSEINRIKRIHDRHKKHGSKSTKDVKSKKSDKTAKSVKSAKLDNDSDIEKRKQEYIAHIDNVMDQIISMPNGSEISVKADPSYDKFVTIKRNNRFGTYIFSGTHSKNLLRIFMMRTADDPEHGYTRIVQLLDNTHGRGFRRFLPINNWKQFWVSYKGEPIKFRALYELILSDRPCKPYLDIEWEADRRDVIEHGSVKNMDLSDFTDKLITDIIKVFTERYNIEIDDQNVMITSSHSDIKVSFHVVVDCVVDGQTVAYRTNLRTEEHSAWDLCYALIKMDDNYYDKLDESVYTTDREFRTVYSNKDSQFRPVAPYHPEYIELTEASRIEDSTSNCMRYIVTYAKNDEYKLIDVPKEKHNRYSKHRNKSSYSSTTSSGSFNTGYDDILRFIPQMYDDEEINEIIKLLRPIHPTAIFSNSTGCNKWRFTYTDRAEPCYTGNIHGSNGFYVYKNEDTGRLYMQCMSDRCKGSYTLKPGRTSIKKRIV